jgi:hypothetical protein
MNQGSTIFSQVISFLPLRQFRRYVRKYKGDYWVQSFSCWDQFLCLAFAQLTYRKSLRDIESCLRAVGVKLYHLGIRGRVSRSTLADANDTRDWRIFEEFGKGVIALGLKVLPDDEILQDVKNTVYALDSTVVEVCLSLFPWAYFTPRESKGGVKVHTLLDVKRNIPVFIDITERKVHDTIVLDRLILEPGAFYIIDRGYLHWNSLYRITRSGAFFVSRAKTTTALKRLRSYKVDKATGVRSDQLVRTAALNKLHRRRYPARLRRISFYDKENYRKLVFLTNNFELPAHTIAQLYKCRWQIELFFKWIKQHLQIQRFYGNSKNAIKIQIWVAVTVYVLVAIVRKRLDLKHSLYSVLQVLSVTLLEKKPILHAFCDLAHTSGDAASPNQLNLLLESSGQ